MSNKSLLTIVIVLLLGVFAFVAIDANQDTPAEALSSSISEAGEEIGDEIDDATTGN